MIREAKKVVIRAAMALVAVFALSVAAFADDWQVNKLRGGVFAWDGTDWQELERGSIVSDNRVVRTAKFSRAEFVRDDETIELGPETQIRIFDRKGERFTIVQQHFGSTAIEAEKKDVKHFAVQTPFLAAVVKGTRFSVSTNGTNSNVDVTRGSVEVRDTVHQMMTQIGAGQSASSGNQDNLTVAGTGNLPQVVGYEGSANAINVRPTGVVNASANGEQRGNSSNAKQNFGQSKKLELGVEAGTNGNGKGNSNASAKVNVGNGVSASVSAGASGNNGNGNSGNNGNRNNSGNNGNGNGNGNGNRGVLGSVADTVDDLL